MKITACWVMGGNSFFAFIPRWRCLEYDRPILNTSLAFALTDSNVTENILTGNTAVDGEDSYWTKLCSIGDAKCIKFEYEEGMYTLVPEVKILVPST